MPETSARWSELVALDAPMAKQFWLGFGAIGDQRRESLIRSLFNVQGSDTADEKSFGVGTLSSKGWEEFEESRRVGYDDVDRGFEKTYTHVEFAKGVVVERKLIDDNNTRIAFGDANQLGDSAWRKREKDAASVFNNAFTDTGPDGESLCDTDHPLSGDNSTTWSNEGSSALSSASLEDTRVEMQAFQDSSGDIMDVVPDLLIIPPALESQAAQLAQSELDPESGNNAINPATNRFSYLVWHYLTDANNWFLVDRRRMSQFLNWFDRVPLEFAAEPDFDTLQRKYRAYMRYSFGYDDARFCYGHSVG
jgi:phage major head subunit gpT-like protein